MKHIKYLIIFLLFFIGFLIIECTTSNNELDNFNDLPSRYRIIKKSTIHEFAEIDGNYEIQIGKNELILKYEVHSNQPGVYDAYSAFFFYIIIPEVKKIQTDSIYNFQDTLFSVRLIGFGSWYMKHEIEITNYKINFSKITNDTIKLNLLFIEIKEKVELNNLVENDIDSAITKKFTSTRIEVDSIHSVKLDSMAFSDPIVFPDSIDYTIWL